MKNNRIGTDDILAKQQLRFNGKDHFYEKLRNEVQKYFARTDQNKKATILWYTKAWGLISLYALAYLSLLLYGQNHFILYFSFASMGVLSILLGMNVGHDAAHGTISKCKKRNKRYQMVFDLLGGNSYLWRVRHVYGHHPYPNVMGYDVDIKQSKLVRIFPKDRYYFFHKLQHIYTPILLIFGYTLNWFFLRDFKDLKERQFGNKNIKKHPSGTFIKMLLSKLFYLSWLVFIPLCFYPTTDILIGFLLMNICSGIVISITLISVHIGEHREFPMPEPDGSFSHSWSMHQIMTTSDFCTKNKFINFILGGFNHHVIHHLFPKINHIHFVKLTPILAKLAREHFVNYHVEETFTDVYKAHIKLLKREGYEYLHVDQEF